MKENRSSSAKERWAAKQVEKGAKALGKPVDGRLPAGQHLTEGFPVLDLGIQPVHKLGEQYFLQSGYHQVQTLDLEHFHTLKRTQRLY